MNDYGHHLAQLQTLVREIAAKAPAKDKEVMYLCERAIAHLWEIRDCAEVQFIKHGALSEMARLNQELGLYDNLPKAKFPGQY